MRGIACNEGIRRFRSEHTVSAVNKVDGKEKLCELNRGACYLRFEEYEQATTSCGAVSKKQVRMGRRSSAELRRTRSGEFRRVSTIAGTRNQSTRRTQSSTHRARERAQSWL